MLQIKYFFKEERKACYNCGELITGRTFLIDRVFYCHRCYINKYVIMPLEKENKMTDKQIKMRIKTIFTCWELNVIEFQGKALSQKSLSKINMEREDRIEELFKTCKGIDIWEV